MIAVYNSIIFDITMVPKCWLKKGENFIIDDFKMILIEDFEVFDEKGLRSKSIRLYDMHRVNYKPAKCYA